MASVAGDLNQKLFQAYKARYPGKTPGESQRECDVIWKTAKQDFKGKQDEFFAFIRKKIEECQSQTTTKKVRSLLDFFGKVSIFVSSSVMKAHVCLASRSNT